MVRSLSGGSLTPEWQLPQLTQVAHFDRNPIFIFNSGQNQQELWGGSLWPEWWLTLLRNMQSGESLTIGKACALAPAPNKYNTFSLILKFTVPAYFKHAIY